MDNLNGLYVRSKRLSQQYNVVRNEYSCKKWWTCVSIDLSDSVLSFKTILDLQQDLIWIH